MYTYWNFDLLLAMLRVNESQVVDTILLECNEVPVPNGHYIRSSEIVSDRLIDGSVQMDARIRKIPVMLHGE